MARITPLEIVRRTPRSNCGACGYPACLAFGAAVAAKGEDPCKCPYLDHTDLDLSDTLPLADSLQRDLDLVRHLKSKISTLSFAEIAPALGGVHRKKDDILLITYLGREAAIGHAGILLAGMEPEDPRDQVLLYNYVAMACCTPLSGEWTGMESMPNSISKIKTLERYCELPLAELFSKRTAASIMEAMVGIGGSIAISDSASLAITVDVLPKIPQQILLWGAEPEDGFEAHVKILFDRTALNYLDLESLVFSSERMVDRWAELLA